MIRIRKTLIAHPQNRFSDLSVAVAVDGSVERLKLLFSVQDSSKRVVWPSSAPLARSKSLWSATCFELFARVKGQEDYCEWNFSPNQSWGYFDFSAPRLQRQITTFCGLFQPPELQNTQDLSTVIAELSLAQAIPSVMQGAAVQLGLSCVIATDEGLEYFALAHLNPQKADFHQFGSWLVDLP